MNRINRSHLVRPATPIRRTYDMVLNQHPGATRFEAHDLVPLSQPYHADDGDEALMRICGQPRRWIAKHKNPRYAAWGVALEPIEPDAWGRVAVSGTAIARINHDPSTTILDSCRGWLDVHPDPDTEEGENPRWGLERAHGRAKLLKRFYLDPESGGDRQYYAAIDLSQSCHTFPVQAQKTYTPGTAIQCVTGHSLYPNVHDKVTVKTPYWAWTFFAIGREDIDNYTGTCGMARWTGEYNTAEDPGDGLTAGNIFEIVDWPSEFEVEVQADFDERLGVGATCRVKLYSSVIPGAVGDLIGAPIGYSTLPYPLPPTWKTAHGSEGALAVLRCSQVPYYGVEYWIEAAPFLDEPYGTIRMIDSWPVADSTGPYPGWKWCDGVHATPDLTDRFIVGGGNPLDGAKHQWQTTGGHATHGNGTNDHTDHETGSAYTNNMAGQTVAPGGVAYTHSETDNEPPWYAVAFAKRVQIT